MPTPLEILLDPISLIILVMYAVLMIWEAIFPARQLPSLRMWKTKGLIAFFGFFYLSSYLPLIWDEYISTFQFFDLSGMGSAIGVIVGLLVYELAVYVWHRSMHASNMLWRGIHQMHHSAERLDSYSAFWFSPLDMLGWTLLGSLALVLVVGVEPQAATIIILLTTFFSLFTHTNIKTPHWLGYIIQRPESHRIHHATGVHAHNYSDLPLFDILFGTFINPVGEQVETGFYPGASSLVVDMLLFRDVSKPKVIKHVEIPTDVVHQQQAI